MPALGVRAWGDITMTDSEGWKERRNQVVRYRVMEHETTDPLAARLLHDIVLDLEAELEGSPQSVGLMLVAHLQAGVSLGHLRRTISMPSYECSRLRRFPHSSLT